MSAQSIKTAQEALDLIRIQLKTYGDDLKQIEELLITKSKNRENMTNEQLKLLDGEISELNDVFIKLSTNANELFVAHDNTYAMIESQLKLDIENGLNILNTDVD